MLSPDTIDPVRVIHLFDKSFPRDGGMTIAYCPVLYNPDTGRSTGNFARVSVTYCKRGDTYNRKLGEATVRSYMMQGAYILMPIYASNHPTKTLIDIFKRF